MTDGYYRFCDECKAKIHLIRGGAGRILCVKCSGGKEDNCTDCQEPTGGVQLGEGFVRCSRCHTYYVEARNYMPYEMDIQALRFNMLSLMQSLRRDSSDFPALFPLHQAMLTTLGEIDILLPPDSEVHDD